MDPLLALGQLALHSRLLDPQSLAKILALQHAEFGRGRFPRVGELLVASKVCSADQVRGLLAQQGVRVVACGLCGTRYNALEPFQGARACLRCGRALGGTAPADPLSVEDTLADPGSAAEARLAEWRQRSRARLRDYWILGEIGRGGMGVVYKAWDPAHQRTVAIKLLLQPDSAPWEEKARFRREAQALTTLRHPNVVQAHALEETEGLLYIVMDFVPGVPLGTLIERRSLTAPQVVAICAGVARALACAHEAGLVHRDVKPDNVVVDRNLTGYLVDFGLLKADAESMSLTQVGNVVGTLGFMAPEYVTQGVEAVDPQCDVYGLGAVLYQSLSGHLPFEAENDQGMIARILSDAPTPIGQYAPRLPQRLVEVVMRAVSKDRGARHPSAAALAEALEGALRG